MSALTRLRILRPASPSRSPVYWYHAESDCAFMTTDRDAEFAAANDGCDRLERWEYESVVIHLELGTPIGERRPLMRGGFGR